MNASRLRASTRASGGTLRQDQGAIVRVVVEKKPNLRQRLQSWLGRYGLGSFPPPPIR